MRNQTLQIRPLFLLLGLVTLISGGCEDVGDRVVVEVNMAGFSPREELDLVEVTIAASATAEGDRLCEPYSATFAVNPEDATDFELVTFPLRIAVKPGPIYDKILYVRVQGWQDGIVRLKSERMVSLRGGDVQLQVLLPRDCIGVGTGAGRHCVGGLAMESPFGPIFDDNLHVAPGAPSCVVE